MSRTLHVLRLVIARQTRSITFSLFPPPPEIKRRPVGIFLEQDAEEYREASKRLASVASSSSALCEVIVKAVRRRDFAEALGLLHQMRQAGLTVRERYEYKDAALDALKRGNKEEFVEWMELYPYSGDDPTTIGQRRQEVFDDLRDIIRELRGMDEDTAKRFLQLCARKGILASVIEHFIADWGATLRPERSLPMFVDVLNTFAEAAPERSDTFVREVVTPSMSKWLNTYIRRIALAGWYEQAEALYQRLPKRLDYVSWRDPTGEIVGWKFEPRERRAEEGSLAKRVRAALHHVPSPTELAQLLNELESRPSLLKRFRQHLIRRPGNRYRPISSSRGERRLDQAEILRSRPEDAIRYFLERYRYTLPQHPEVDRLEIKPWSKTAEPPLASIHIITALIPALLETLPRKLLPSFHRAYLKQVESVAPFQRPTHATHSIFMRKIAKSCHGQQARRSLLAIAKAGMDPGPMAATWVLLGLARRGDWQQLEEFLGKMQRQEVMAGEVRFPAPSERTLGVVVGMLEEHRMGGVLQEAAAEPHQACS
ncbi:hypothetical protein BD324DRAFT_610766 [Kockovaella imperatae]|uniref:Uncharacterized protein n=1 Tax=Kockovaella imperatae TaxID=4999 RepID=A0A1Y1UR82_9TREE|nr:hypothetical protein BD324DRAFT_610766 [Kockovaella imperatae]ORX40452.1 hypothetical protein BD324DRAFT_610766 [Kockovaella imperatae]